MSDYARAVGRLARFMQERHEVYLARERGEPEPWTEDPILREWKFTNVYRELDRVTVWVREKIREPHADSEHLWFMLAIARYVNWPETLEEMMGHGFWPDNPGFRLDWITEVLEARRSRGEKVYTGAYMIRAEGHEHLPWYSWPKSRYLAEIVLGRLWEDREWWGRNLAVAGSLEEVWLWFQEPRYIGWGPFMAYEVVTDLRWTRYLDGARDIYSWACAGPGALRGLNRLHGRPVSRGLRQSIAVEEMRDVLVALSEWWPRGWPILEMREVEHSLCEFDKYERVRLGQGRPRARFRPGGAR